jgi:hypothetical protein
LQQVERVDSAVVVPAASRRHLSAVSEGARQAQREEVVPVQVEEAQALGVLFLSIVLGPLKSMGLLARVQTQRILELQEWAREEQVRELKDGMQETLLFFLQGLQSF